MKHQWFGTFGSVSLAGVMVGALTSCVGGYRDMRTSGDAPSQGLGRLAELSEFLFAYELKPGCQLERGEGGPSIPGPEGFKRVNTNTMTSRTFKVQRRQIHANDNGQVDFVALEVSEGAGSSFWLRNTPTTNPAQAVTSWRCVVSSGWAKDKVPKLDARVVELAPTPGACPALIPIAGTTDDVTFAPYTVSGLGIYAGDTARPQDAVRGDQGVLAIGVRLEADGGEKSLLVPSSVFDRCFVPATRVPPKPSEASDLLKWLTGSNPDATTPPAVTGETIKTIAGLDPASCLKEGSGTTEHLECRGPLLRVARSDVPGPFGPPFIDFTRERFVDAIHLYGDKLIPATEIISVNAVVRTPRLNREGTFAKVFQEELRASLADPDRARARALRGFRVLASNEVNAATKATHYVDIELNYDVPEVETTTEKRSHKYVAGTKRVHNPEYDKAEKELAEAKAAVPNAEAKVRLAETALATAEQTCKQGASQLGWLAGTIAKGACGVASSAAVNAARGAVASAKQRLEKATSDLSNTPTEVDVNDERDWQYEARILRRKGAATAKLTILTDKQVLQYTGTISVPFDASDVEIPDDPEHKLVGKKAKSPSVEEVERALAEALMPRIDESVIKWGAQRQVGGDIGDLRPGTRSWMVAVARRASNDRPIKLLSDILEDGKKALSAKEMTFPVKIPDKSEKRCFTLAAIPTGGVADVNLEFGRTRGGKGLLALARDARKDFDAATEVCNLTPGDYVVHVFFGEGETTADGVLVSLFDSTPGAVKNEDTLAAAKGIPTTRRKGQELVLDGGGETRFVASAGRVVVGKTGDRDGDTVLDDDDRCPYDQETKNGYRDDDGCPDVPPAGWKRTEETTAAAPVPTQQVKAEAKSPPTSAKKPEAKKPEAKKPEAKKPEAKKPEEGKPEPKQEKKKPAIYIP